MKKLIIDFKDLSEKGQWERVNDVVMGGVSGSRFTVEEGIALFQGEVSLENYGGFASIRSLPRDFGLEGCNGLIVRVRGDGKSYRLRLRTDDEYDGIAYQAVFQADRGNVSVGFPSAGLSLSSGDVLSWLPAFSGQDQEGRVHDGRRAGRTIPA
jgi:hypothetical protein